MNVKVMVPASTANIGPGFDSIGIALNLYLSVIIGEKADAWQVHHSFEEDIPTDKENLIVSTAVSIVPNLQPHHLYVDSEIPLTRGLGSSGSAIVAGIEIANIIGDLKLTPEQKVQLASKIEGHPDNVAPSILGGIVVGVTLEGDTPYCVLSKASFDILAVIPNTELKTSISRSILPTTVSYKQAIRGSGISNVLVAALCTDNPTVLSHILEQDLFHEPYRKQFVPYFDEIRTIVKEAGGYGTVLSGAGPTLISFLPIGYSEKVKGLLEQLLPASTVIKKLRIDEKGVRIHQMI